ncbi:hypothetical protein BKH41_03895 [Helicobacter sp. 12S02232-10]|uniref:hypothetical protein n=1 Tax=Helicobacter sp. 12S02232-10 TaxID=1476197 RepID=UPI000BD81C87|nr:hypothetical protein [Helicobacter sp. 12S02232-10]PAF49231.1 hypothetical protein BKH41_03895 [Helicobacter sp. 12S02232-10]
MNPTLLSTQIKTALQAKGFASTKENEAFIEVLCKEIINHIVTQSTIVVTTTGSATAQTGTGKIS